VTLSDTDELVQLDAGGVEVRRVRLRDSVTYPQHAVESPSGTFVVGHKNAVLQQRLVSEVDVGGRVLRQFTCSRSSSLGSTPYIAVDWRGNVLVADHDGRRVLLLDAQLTLRRVVIDEHQLDDRRPRRLCYTEQSGQLLVGFDYSVAVFHVLRQ